MTEKIIDIGKDFSKYPGGRVRSDGPFSGEVFREDYLIPALNENDKVIVIIDGVMGYGSSFLEECFGGLIRRGKSTDELNRKLIIESQNPVFEAYKNEIWDYIRGQ